MELILIFSGINGIFKGSGEVKTGGYKIFSKPEKETKPIPFTLLEAKEYSLCKIYLFDPNP